MKMISRLLIGLMLFSNAGVETIWAQAAGEGNSKAIVLFDAEHTKMENWRDAWDDGVRSGAELQIGARSFKVVGTETENFYGVVYRTLDWDLDKYPFIEINVESCNTDWYIVVQNTNILGFSKNDYVKPEEGTKEVGLRSYNVRKATGLTGVRRIRLELGVATSERPGNKGLNFKVSSLRLASAGRGKIFQNAPPEITSEKSTVETTQLGWNNHFGNGQMSGAYLKKSTGGKLKLIGEFPKQCYGCVVKPMSIDITKYPRLQVEVTKLTAPLYIIFEGSQFRGGYQRLLHVDKPGVWVSDLKKELNYLEGPQNFIFQLGITTDNNDRPNKDKEVEFYSVKFMGAGGGDKLVAGSTPAQVLRPAASAREPQSYTEGPLGDTFKRKFRSLAQGNLLARYGAKNQAKAVMGRGSVPQFAEKNGNLLVRNDYYEVAVNRSSGVIESVVDVQHHSQVVTSDEHAFLWRLMFEKGDYLSSQDFLNTPQSKFSYEWQAKSETLRLIFKRAASVMTVSLAFSHSNYFDFSANFQNQEDRKIIGVDMPKLYFDYRKLEKFYFPWYMGLALNQNFFKKKHRWKTTYPFVFTDLVNWGFSDGGQFSAFLLWADKPIEPTRLNVGYSRGERGVYEHGWTTYILPKTSWEGQPLRLVLGERIESVLQRSKRDNKLTSAPLLVEKLGKTLFDKMRRGVFLKVSLDMNRNFAYVNQYFSELPKDTIIHFVSWWLEGFDHHMPDFWPVDPNYGTDADFKKSIQLAKQNGMEVIPYINPTFWNEGPSLTRVGGPNDISCRNLNGQIIFESYPSGGKGWAVSPRHPEVIKTGNYIAEKFFKELKIDALFLDQIGARILYYDLNRTLGHATGYAQGWFDNCKNYLKYGPLMTEQGYDRLIPMMSGFFGLMSFSVPDSLDYNTFFGEDNWEYFPMAQYLSHEHVMLANHNLAHEVFCDSHKKIMFYLAHGYHMLNGRWVSEWPSQKPWFDLNDQLQKNVVWRYVGQPLLNYRQIDSGRLYWSAYPDLGLLVNVSDTLEQRVFNHTLSKNGFMASDASGNFLAGRFSRLFGFDLSDDQYLIIETEKNRIKITQMQNKEALLTVPRPESWTLDGGISVRQGNDPVPLSAVTPNTVSFFAEADLAAGASTYSLDYNPNFKPAASVQILTSEENAVVNSEMRVGLEAKNYSSGSIKDVQLVLTSWLIKRNGPPMSPDAGVATLAPSDYFKTKAIADLSSGKVVSAEVPFSVPKDAEIGDVLWLKAEMISKGDKRKKLGQAQSVIRVIAPFDVTVEADRKAASAGESLTFSMDVKNNFTKKVKGKLSLQLPEDWHATYAKNLDLDPEETKHITFKTETPNVGKIKTYFIPAVFQTEKDKGEALPLKVEASPQWRIISVDGPKVLVQGQKCKNTVRLIPYGDKIQSGSIQFKASAGLQVEKREMDFEASEEGEQDVEFTLIPESAGAHALDLKIESPQGEKTAHLSYAVIAPDSAKAVTGDLLNRGDKDVILANSEVEVQALTDLGGRILSLYSRKSGANMFFQNYPKVKKREGDKDWVEYGGVNDWFPTGWPGVVWNNVWNAQVVNASGKEASVKMSTKINNFLLERTMTLPAHSRQLRLDYAVTNTSEIPQKYQWFSHPDLVPGTENMAGEDHRIVVPVADPENMNKTKIMTDKFIAKIDKDTYVPTEGWALALNDKTKDYFLQKFDTAQIGQIGVWQDSNFYTMELLGKEVTIPAGQVSRFTVYYVVGNNNWKEELK